MTVSLKEDALVLVTEDDGGLPVGAATRLGLYYHDTQFLSGFAMRVNGVAPILLSSNTEQNSTNVPLGSLPSREVAQSPG